MAISTTILVLLIGTFSIKEYKKSLENDVLNTMKIMSDDIVEHQLYTMDEEGLRSFMLSKDNYHHENYISYIKNIDFKFTSSLKDVDYELMVSKRLPDRRYLIIYSSNEDIKRNVQSFVINLSLGSIAILFIMIGLFYILLRKLLLPFSCLVDYCNNATNLTTVPECGGSYEIESLRDAIVNLQENNIKLCKDKQEIFKEAAHEIKTPIAILKARLSLYKQDEMDKSEFIQESMLDIATISNKLRELIFLKAIEWDIQKAKEYVQMQNQCIMMQQLFGPILSKKNIKMVPSISRDFTLHIHKEAMQRVMQAVFENIFMHTKDGTTIYTYIDADKQELKIVNEIGEKSDEVLFSSHIGTKLIERLSQKLDYKYESSQKEGFFYTTIHFNSKQNLK
jgi:hypothetical protein